jgi:hypothetical protein
VLGEPRRIEPPCFEEGTAQRKLSGIGRHGVRGRKRLKVPGGVRYVARPTDDVFALAVMAYRMVTDEYPPLSDAREPTSTPVKPVEPER